MIAQGTLIERLVAFGCGDEQEVAVRIRDVADRFNLEYTVADRGEGVTSYWTSADAGVIQDEIENDVLHQALMSSDDWVEWVAH